MCQINPMITMIDIIVEHGDRNNHHFFSSIVFSERIETQSLLCEKLIAYVSR